LKLYLGLREHTSIYSTIDLHWKWKNHKKSKWIFWITRQLFPIILVQDPHSDPLWMKHCMSNKKIISYFQYPVNKTVFTISSKSLEIVVLLFRKCIWIFYDFFYIYNVRQWWNKYWCALLTVVVYCQESTIYTSNMCTICWLDYYMYWYALFINGENETALYRQLFVI
jgi:hypothetical protein